MLYKRILPALMGCLLFTFQAAAQEPTPVQPTPTPTPQPQVPVARPASQQPSVNAAELLRRLEASGLTPQQIRQRLNEAGFRDLGDPYLRRLEVGSDTRMPGAADVLPPPTNEFVDALRSIGIIQTGEEIESARQVGEAALPGVPAVFGRSLFQGSTTQFLPMTTGPVSADYRLGPGDQIILVLTGDVQATHELDVTREGYIVVPTAGQIFVNGLTLDGLRERLFQRLSQLYGGMSRNGTGTAHFDVSLGRLRTNMVYLIGDVSRPGSYQISATSSVFDALHQGGGPAVGGSFRRIQVRRGGTVIREVDIYDYLLRGDASDDIRVEQGDIIFVPPAGPQVTVEGAVRRPAIFELRPNEGLVEVFAFAGGVQARAFLQRIQIDRILPAEQRAPGRERVLMDVDLSNLRIGSDVALQDGDNISVFAISEERRNRVTVRGGVLRPGDYEFTPGMTVQDLIDRASGLVAGAYTPTAHLIRVDARNGTSSLLRTSLGADSAGMAARNIALQDLDEVVIYSRPDLLHRQAVTIQGLVKQPGSYPLAEGMTAHDLILAAGGFSEGALQYSAEVARRASPGVRGDSLASVWRIPLSLGLPPVDSMSPFNQDQNVAVHNFILRHGDQVFIRRLPGFAPVQTVAVTGEVLFPGNYPLENRQQTVSDLVRRAGGLVAQAYVPGARLVRDNRPLAINFERALKRPHSREDLVLEPGDHLEIPRLDPTVLVMGAVAFEARVPYQKSMSLADYLDRAGGVREDGNRNRVSVRYPNSEIRTVRRNILLTGDPKVEPGSVIVVPQRTAGERFDWERFAQRGMALLSTAATIILTIKALE